MTYAEKLKDPRWQKKRLEIFDRDHWTCQTCLSKEKTLCVHHKRYNGDPWDAANEDMETVCAECHEAVEYAIRLLSDNGIKVREFGALNCVYVLDQIEQRISRGLSISQAIASALVDGAKPVLEINAPSYRSEVDLDL